MNLHQMQIERYSALDTRPRKFNINQSVLIKPTLKGYDLLSDQHIQFVEFNDTVYVRMQMWEVMNIFGSYMRNGFDLVIETDIIFQSHDLQPVK